jgi:hypothetical protein
VNSGDPSAPKPSPAARPASRAAPKKAAQSTKSAIAGAREPRVSVSKAGVAAKRVSSSGAAGADDILDRLARLGEAPTSARPPMDSSSLPTIVEADPTFPPLAVPAAARTAGDTDTGTDDTAGTAGTAGTTVDDADITADTDRSDGMSLPQTRSERSAPVLQLAAVPTMASPSTSVSADLPTGLIGAPASAPTDPAPLSRADPAIESPDPAPEHTHVVPVMPTMPIEFAPAESVPAIGIDETAGIALPKRPLRAPMVFRRAKPRVRRVTRVVRHLDTWSVFKVALVFNVILYLVCLTSGVLLWNVAHATGTVDNVEKFFEQFGWESFEFKGGEIYHNAWIGGLFVAVGLTGFAVLLATLFNLITDLVGGIRVSVLEEEVVARSRPASPASPTAADPTDGAPRP